MSHSRGMSFLHLVPILPLLLVAFLPSACATIFNITSFAPTVCSLSAVKFSGDAFLSGSGAIQLTRKRAAHDRDEAGSSHGQAIYANPVRLHHPPDFSTNFTFAFNGLSEVTDSIDVNKLAFFVSPAEMGSGSRLQSKHAVTVEFNHMEGSIHVNSNSVAIANRKVSPNHSSKRKSDINGYLRGEARVGYNSANQTLFASLIYQNNKLDPMNLFLHINLTRILPENGIMVGFLASTHRSKVIHTISRWEFRSGALNPAPSPLPAPWAIAGNAEPLSTNTKHNKRRIIALVTCLALLILIVIAKIILIIVHKVRNKRKEEEDDQVEENDDNPEEDDHNDVSTPDISFDFSTGPTRFSYTELSDATDNFSQEGKLGEGGFGLVYHGTIAGMREEVAVKRFAKGSRHGKEFVVEATVISRLRHRNLVPLIGWCHEKGELLLVYEYMTNGSLDSHLFGTKAIMPWAQRMWVGLGLASAILYLHEECMQCVLHRDIKSSNVMIDSEFNARLGDFGLARLVDHNRDGHTTKVAGTMGYLAPECVITGKASKECDVYSFGVVLLELATGLRGSRTVGELEDWLVEWVWKKYDQGALLDSIDQRLGLEFDRHEAECMMLVGLWCLHSDPHRRPPIRDAMLVLRFQADLPRIPAKMPSLVYYEPPPYGDESGPSLTSCSRTTTTSLELTPRSLLQSFKDRSKETWAYII